VADTSQRGDIVGFVVRGDESGNGCTVWEELLSLTFENKRNAAER
jgi:hypothetical protein